MGIEFNNKSDLSGVIFPEKDVLDLAASTEEMANILPINITEYEAIGNGIADDTSAPVAW